MFSLTLLLSITKDTNRSTFFHILSNDICVRRPDIVRHQVNRHQTQPVYLIYVITKANKVGLVSSITFEWRISRLWIGAISDLKCNQYSSVSKNIVLLAKGAPTSTVCTENGSFAKTTSKILFWPVGCLTYWAKQFEINISIITSWTPPCGRSSFANQCQDS